MINATDQENPNARFWLAGSCDQKCPEGSVFDHLTTALRPARQQISAATVGRVIAGRVTRQPVAPVSTVTPDS